MTTTHTTVDGNPAVIDSTATAENRLLEVSTEELVHTYANLHAEREKHASEAGYWRGRCKELDERIEPVLAELRRRDRKAHGADAAQHLRNVAEDESHDDEPEEIPF